MTQAIQYMLLSRLKSDCLSHFDYGARLWGITPEAHADEMVKIWNELKVKPNWFTLKELKEFYYKLTRKELE